MLAILKSRGQRTLAAVFAECVVTGIWALLDPAFVIKNATWFVIVGIVGSGALWFWNDINGYIAYKSVRSKKEDSPFHVGDYLQTEAVDVLDEKGRLLTDVKAINVALRVTNTRSQGQTLRNVQARLHFISGESNVLPIRNTATSSQLRHGEIAVIEIGHVPVSKADANAMHSNRAKYAGHRYDGINAINGNRSLSVSDASGQNRRHYIGQTPGGPRPFRNICVVLTADDVPSRTVWLDMDLYKDKPWEWFTVKLEPTYDD